MTRLDTDQPRFKHPVSPGRGRDAEGDRVYPGICVGVNGVLECRGFHVAEVPGPSGGVACRCIDELDCKLSRT